MLLGNGFLRVGADAEKEREPNRRLVHGTLRSLDVEERKALVGAYAHNCWARLGGCPVSKALNVNVAILNLMRHSTGSQWSCFRR